MATTIEGMVENRRSAVKTKNYFIVVLGKTSALNGIMRDLRRGIDGKGRVSRNSKGGVDIKPLNPCCPDSVSNLVLCIEDLNLGIAIDPSTMPKVA
jgi:hypothetical protein